MSDLKDNVAKRYLWNDYAHFELNRDGCDDWRYRAVLDVMKLEQENAELRELIKKAYIEGINVADGEFDDRDFILQDTDRTKADFWNKSEVKKKMENNNA